MANEVLTFRTFLKNFTDFFTVAIHTILYERELYPERSFLIARKYNLAVRQSRHPKVCEWVNDSTTAVESELSKGTLQTVAVVIYTENNKPFERFVFDLSRFPSVPPSELDVPLDRLTADGSKIPVLPSVDLEEQLRAFMSTLVNCSSKLGTVPKGCTFTIAIELKSDALAPLGHPQPWVPAEINGDSPDRHSAQSTMNVKFTTPLRAVRAGDMVFEAWVEQVGLDQTHHPSSLSTT